MGEIAAFRLSLQVPEASAERIADAISEGCDPAPDAVSLFEGDGGAWRVEAYFASRPGLAAVSAIIDSVAPSAVADLRVEAIEQQDWAAQSQAILHPVRAGRFVVHGSHDRERLAPSRWRLEIDAGQAFGTAHHGSTQGCLIALDWLGRRLAFHNMLDVGTGSGILAIAGVRLWRCPALATDSDPVAIGVALGNAIRNRAPMVRFSCATGLAADIIRARAPYDLVCANILAGPLIEMAPGMARLCTQGGYLILSGITRDQAPGVTAAYRAAGFARVRLIMLGNWVTAVMCRRMTWKV